MTALVPATIAALALGAVLGWLAGAARASAAARESAAKLAAAEARLDAERRGTEEKLAAMRDAEMRLTESFQLLSGNALRQNNEAFLQLAQSQFANLQQLTTADLEARHRAIGELVLPLRQTLEKVDGKLQQVEKERVGAYEMLIEQVRSMGEGQRQLAERTQKLVDSLRSPTVRGRWGEIQLKRVCEMAGMVDHCDFVEQASVDGENGKLRPDVTVKLPGGKLIIVDAKAPLMAYLDAMEATDEETRAARLRDHARQVRDHITKLSAKSYWGQFDRTPEIVVMFLPGETFFSAALQYDPALIEYGVEQKVIPASPTTLIALLRSISYGWQQEQIARNAQEISAAGRALYDRITVFATHYADLRKHLGKAVDTFNKSVGSLERNVLPQARRFRELGATTAAELDDVGMVDTALRVLEAPDVAPAILPPVDA
ncbi:MAG TPA: DNA recombination protein RmuC [Gemmatimonadaceae bacterium]|nr:DNA recombination protein RmuC [Gemmatimonadaceae bacterium]